MKTEKLWKNVQELNNKSIFNGFNPIDIRNSYSQCDRSTLCVE